MFSSSSPPGSSIHQLYIMSFRTDLGSSIASFPARSMIDPNLSNLSYTNVFRRIKICRQFLVYSIISGININFRAACWIKLRCHCKRSPSWETSVKRNLSTISDTLELKFDLTNIVLAETHFALSKSVELTFG